MATNSSVTTRRSRSLDSVDWEDFENKCASFLGQFSSNEKVESCASSIFSHVKKGENNPRLRSEIAQDLMSLIQNAKKKSRPVLEDIQDSDFDEDLEEKDDEDGSVYGEEEEEEPQSPPKSRKRAAAKPRPAEIEEEDDPVPEAGTTSRTCSVEMDKITAAVESPFFVNCMSYQGNYKTIGSSTKLDLDAVCHVKFQPEDESGKVSVKEITMERKNHTNSNFVVMKFLFNTSLKLTMKLYSTRYFQIYGVADVVGGESGDQICELLVEYVRRDLDRGGTATRVGQVEGLRLIALSAVHRGFSDANLSLNLVALKAALRKDPEIESLSNNSRTGALMVKGGGVGSWFYHAKGTVQIFGTKMKPTEVAAIFRRVILRHPHVVEVGENAVSAAKKKAKKAKSRAKRARDD